MRDLTPSCPEPTFGPGLLRLSRQTVQSDWIDYNGHMNVAYYSMAFDQAFDDLLENVIGIGESFVARSRLGPMALQSQFHYIDEMMEGEGFFIDALMVDTDAKRMHVYGEMIAEKDGRKAATFESLSMCVDLEARRSTPYPDWAQARLQAMMQAQADIPRPAEIGRPIGIRRKA